MPSPALTIHPKTPRESTVALLPRCRTLRDVDQIHARLITTGLLRDPSLTAHIVLYLCSSPRLPLHHSFARRLFFSTPRPNPSDPFLWNALIKSSSSHGPHPALPAILTFSRMISEGVSPDEFSFSLALKACSRTPPLEEGSQIHALILKSRLRSDLFLQNCLIRFYSRFGLVVIARRVFDVMGIRDSVTWNSMIDGYAKVGMMGPAQELFDQMGDDVERNVITWNSMIGGYALLRSTQGIDVARGLFDRMPIKDLVSWNSVIDGYVKCGRLTDALNLFEKMPEKDVVAWATIIFGFTEIGNVDSARRLFDDMSVKDIIAWNVMISGYAKNGCFVEVLCLFREMGKNSNISPDITTLTTALSAVAELGRIHDGISIHDYVQRKRLPLDGKLGVALIDMYSKCGQLGKALQVFEVSGWRSVDHCNAMIGGLAIHGLGHLALQLFRQMDKLSLRPDDITFIGILNACSHAGLVKEGLLLFEIMRQVYGVEPKVQHYGCMVDILGRAGLLEEAIELVEGMPMEPNDVILRALLSACRNHGDFDISQEVAKHMIETGSCNSSSYVLLSNVYAGVGMWDDVTKIRMMMKEQNIRKVPGCSWIELDGVVHEFVVGDKSHPKAKEIYLLLGNLCAFKPW